MTLDAWGVGCVVLMIMTIIIQHLLIIKLTKHIELQDRVIQLLAKELGTADEEEMQ